MSVMPWKMNWFLSVAAFIASSAFLWWLLMLVVYYLAVIMAKPQEGRRKKCRHRGNKWHARRNQALGKGRCPAKPPAGPMCPPPHQGMPHLLTLSPLPAAFTLLESSQPSRTHCPVHPEMDGVYETVHQFNRTLKDLMRYLDTLNWETPESSDSSWTSITPSEVGSSSRVSLAPSREASPNAIMTSEASSSAVVSLSHLREDPPSSIMASEAGSSAEVSLSPVREDPPSSIMASEAGSSAEVSLSPVREDPPSSIMANVVGCSSRESLPTLVDGEDMDHASNVQPGLEHPETNLEEQPGPATHLPCKEEVARCLEASSVQQHQQDLEIQLGAPTPPPEVPEVHSREMETPFHHNKGQDTLEGLIPEPKLEQELGLPASVDETAQSVPASAPPTRQRPEKRDVMVVPIVQDLPFLDEAVKRELENHITKLKIQRRYGLQMRILDCEQSFENLILR